MHNLDMDEYFSEAQEKLVVLMKQWSPKLMTSHGLALYSHKEDESVVTELDGELELAIKEVLRPLSEDIGFVGEEHGEEGPQGTFWFVDPIDGTEQYIRGLTGCRTLLCLIHEGRPVYSFAYRFTTNDLFKAQDGK